VKRYNVFKYHRDYLKIPYWKFRTIHPSKKKTLRGPGNLVMVKQLGKKAAL